jgi:SAM-dependent methyltransferase
MRIETADDLMDVLGAPTRSAAAGAALELGLFWTLEEGPRSDRLIADEYGLPEPRCRAWLLVLVSLGLLEEDDVGFGLSPAGRSAVLGGASREAWRYLAQEAREAYPLGFDLVHRLGRRGPVTDDPDAITDYVDKLRADPERAGRFTELLYELHGWLGEAVADSVDLGEAHRLLDLGGGSGVVALALLRRFPGLTAVVADIPSVCVAGRSIADRTEFAARIDYRPIDLSADDLPDGFDTIMTCDARFDDGLLARICAALPEGGRYLLVDRWIDTGHAQRAAIAPEVFERSLVDPGARVPTVEQVCADLRAVGLEPGPPVMLVRPHWTMLVAHTVGSGLREAVAGDTLGP